ncbi:CehA/McbA family metallohydrolase [Roseiconus lacunae]|uniref:CehA/McbA family metallohydrolase n=1 Tax=Roseiconus lacunae TaxID=2605694 RepID=UPI0011F2D8CC|nr:CehA/McbA family metallohydrolase [Roseiconus lacunae]
MSRFLSFDRQLFLVSLLVLGITVTAEEGGASKVVAPAAPTVRLELDVVDAASHRPLACRVHLRNDRGDWFHVDSADGQAIAYRRQMPHLPSSPEVHTTVTAASFFAELPPGSYQLRVERGKEYHPAHVEFQVSDEPLCQTITLRRWIDMADRGWYSGDTHVHRDIDELPNVMLAEDLNVAFPITSWVRDTADQPSPFELGPLNRQNASGTIEVDATHVIVPRNTEYEIFAVNGRPRTLGAVLILNQTSGLDLSAPPLVPIAEQARSQGALLDLDKHSWPWSLMIVPTMGIDFFELSNNHVWQTEFGFHQWTIDAVPPYMRVQRDERGLTEWGWIDFGMQTYYELINCGFRMRVTAGTASGVHPVQLGFGRVYVRLPNGFSHQDWVNGLNAGQSFVTTGPMLDLRFNDRDAGEHFQPTNPTDASVRIQGSAISRRPLKLIEVIVNGNVERAIHPDNRRSDSGAYVSEIDLELAKEHSYWAAVRCFEEHPTDRVRFAHTNPVFVDVPGSHIRPRKEALGYFISQLENEIADLEGLIDESSIDEYRQAIEHYRELQHFGTLENDTTDEATP